MIGYIYMCVYIHIYIVLYILSYIIIYHRFYMLYLKKENLNLINPFLFLRK